MIFLPRPPLHQQPYLHPPPPLQIPGEAQQGTPPQTNRQAQTWMNLIYSAMNRLL